MIQPRLSGKLISLALTDPGSEEIIVGKTDDNVDPALIFPGPVALVAGPGSGKTTRLARRTKHLVEDHGADPETIAVITFTVEAARNMKARLTPPPKEGMPDVTLPLALHPPVICTMHSLGARIIAENSNRLGITSEFGLVASWQVRQMLFEDAARLCGESTVFGRLCDQQKQKVGIPADEKQARVFDAYSHILWACNAMDYDDQIILACRLLQEHDDVRDDWQVRATHLLVDEYQDINRMQLELIQLLSGSDPSGLFVVGDDDQSIYGFRGAEPGYIRDFRKHFGDKARIEAIPDCFRCQPHIIKSAHGFISAFNSDRISKPPPERMPGEGSPVEVHDVPSETREAEIIATMAAGALRNGDVLVLLPKPDYAEPLKAELRKCRIAFDAPTSRSSEANRIFAALRDWLTDNGNNLALRELLRAVCDSAVLGIPGPRSKKEQKIAERGQALGMISALWNDVFGGASLREALRNAARGDNLCSALDKLVDDLAQATAGTLTELAQRTFEALKPWSSSARMLDELAAPPSDAQARHDGDANLMRIMTMRNSKGLEAETVFVVGLEEGAFPGGEPGTDEFEEDARLFYVSMTRAKRDLHLFHARKRSAGMTYKPQPFSMKPSPFLGGLPKQHHKKQYHQSAAKRAAKK